MLRNIIKKPIREDFVVIDSQFPQKDPFAFKNVEITEYLKRINNFKSYTMYPMMPDEGAWFTHGYGITYKEFKANKEGYLRHYKQDPDKINYLFPDQKYSFKLAYTYFLAETYVLLPFLEKNKIPFIFVLYPGGGFGLNFNKSDNMLRRIFQSKYFRGVITTQDITKDYLISKQLCLEKQIHHIYGGFVQFKKSDVLPRKKYKKEKDTFDICFVAAKYSEKGVDKGYDLFIEVAKELCKKTNDIMFHVVGGFNKEDVDISGIESRIKFYGYKKPDFLVEFYTRMDIFLAPSRPFKLFEGSFDGFPLGIDAGYCGVAIFVSDKLKMNKHYTNNRDIVIVSLDKEKIANKVLLYYDNPERLYRLSQSCQAKTQELFDTNYQINERLSVFSKFQSLELL